MKPRRRRVPGMPVAESERTLAAVESEASPPGSPAAGGAAPAPAAAERTAVERPSRSEPPRETPPGEATGHRRSPRSQLGASEQGEVNPYTGAGTTSLNVRILVPLHTRYRRLVRALEDEGYRTSSTELFHALLHFGPSDTDVARDLLRRWRAVLDADPPRP